MNILVNANAKLLEITRQTGNSNAGSPKGWMQSPLYDVDGKVIDGTKWIGKADARVKKTTARVSDGRSITYVPNIKITLPHIGYEPKADDIIKVLYPTSWGKEYTYIVNAVIDVEANTFGPVRWEIAVSSHEL